MGLTTFIGIFAAFCTTASCFPQLKKMLGDKSAGDLSLKMFSVLAVGIALWVVYGYLQSDWVIVLANAVSFCCLMGIFYFKLREVFAGTPKVVTSS